MLAQWIKLKIRDRYGHEQAILLPSQPHEAFVSGQEVGRWSIFDFTPVLSSRWCQYVRTQRGLKSLGFRINFIWRLHLLLSSGISLIDSLEEITLDEDEEITRYAFCLLFDLYQGKNFAQAIARLTWLFDEQTIALIDHGEQSGKLIQVLENIVHNDERQLANADKIIRALTYPAMLALILMAVVTLGLVYVIPSYSQLLIDAGKLDTHAPPWWYTLSLWTQQVETWLVLVPLGLLLLGLIWVNRQQMIAALPAVKKLHHAQQMFTFALLYESGIRLPSIINALADSEGHQRQKELYHQLGSRIEHGQSLNLALQQTKLWSPLIVSLLKAGETSGKLGFAAQQAGQCLDRQAILMIKNFEQWLTPVCLICVGGIMAWLFLNLTGTFYDISDL